MEMRQLQLFVLLAEYRNFSKVAEIYNISQSAISKQLSLLEHELGGRLFVRDTRRVEIDELGYVFLPYAKQIVALEKEALTATGNAVKNNMVNPINLCIDSSLAGEAVSLDYPRKILRATYQFNRQHPGYIIQTQYFPQNEWRAQLRFRLFDLALMRVPVNQLAEPVMQTAEMFEIHRIEYYLVMHTQGETYGTISEAVTAIDALLQDQSLTIKDAMGRLLTKLQPTARLVDCNNWADLFSRLMIGRAATLVPENMLTYFRDTDFCIFPLREFNIGECICAFRGKAAAEETIPHFIEALIRAFGEDDTCV